MKRLLLSLGVWVFSTWIASSAIAKNALSTLPDFQLIDPRGGEITQQHFRDASILVVAFLGTECPLAKLYTGTLNRLNEEFEARGVRFLAVMSNRQDSLEEIAAFERRTEVQFPIGKDPANRFADAVRAERTPEVLVFDANSTLRYRGRIDDQYGIGTILDQPRRNDLRIALNELLRGQSVTVDVTQPVGCLIGRRKSQEPSSDRVTYHEHVAPILRDNCVSCHRDQEIGPFALQDYDEVAGWADMIVETTSQGRMPPWHAGPKSQGHFRNERRLSDHELDVLRRWADAGTPAGSPAPTTRISNAAQITSQDKAPQDMTETSPQSDDGRLWQLPRQPDHVFRITDAPVSIPASGEVKYRYYVVDPKLKRDVWVSAMQLRPGNRSVVHHILVFARSPDQLRGLNAARSYLDGYVPGYRVEAFEPGYAKRIPAGSQLVFQVHYTPTGEMEEDLSEFAICEIDASQVTHEVHTHSAVQPKLKIPPGDSDYRVTATGPRIPAGAELLAMMPHMHVRGKSFRYELHQAPRGKSGDRQPTVLLDVPHYDFNWQTAYVLAEPLGLSEDARLVCHASYDNSEKNLSNPDPTATVRWGDQTWEEMMIGYFHYALPRQN